MKPLFVNFFGEMEKKLFIYFSSSSTSFYTIELRSCSIAFPCRVRFFFHAHTLTLFLSCDWPRKINQTKPNTLTPTRTRSNAPTQQYNEEKKLFIVRLYIDMRVVYANRPKWISEGSNVWLPFSLTKYMRFSV